MLFFVVCCSMLYAILCHSCSMHNDSDSESDSDARVKGREKGLEGLMSVGDTYDPELFSDEHTAFKDYHNILFARLSSQLCPGGDVFYLDGPNGGLILYMHLRPNISATKRVLCPYHLCCVYILNLHIHTYRHHQSSPIQSAFQWQSAFHRKSLLRHV